jgi:nucleotide-binding universal stress UspA family protein
MKILFAVDGSSYSLKAAEYLAVHFNWLSEPAELHLLHVELPIPISRARAAMGKEAVDRYYAEEAEAALAPAENILQKHDIRFVRSYAAGDVADAIQTYVKENAIDMIVMGSHGHGALRGLMMGSVATKVIAATTVPVLIIR